MGGGRWAWEGRLDIEERESWLDCWLVALPEQGKEKVIGECDGGERRDGARAEQAF